jgi:hypothetical protein
MSESDWVQVLLVAAAALAVVAIAVGTRRFQRPTHERVDVHGVGLPPGIVIFTSTECGTCRDALAAVRAAAAPVREVTWELESGLFERVGVTAVPLTIVVGAAGDVIAQIVGVPHRRKLARAVAALSAPGGR